MEYAEFKNIDVTKRTNCITCGNELSAPVLTLSNLPLTEFYTSEKVEPVGFVDQTFHFCEICHQGQLGTIVPPKFLYSDSDAYMTRTSTSHSAKWAVEIFKNFIDPHLEGRVVNDLLDIGCNDTFLLNEFSGQAKKLWGIDPILNGREKELKSDQLSVIGDFIENVSFKERGIQADVVISSHTLEHIEDPKKTLLSLLEQTHENTLFFFQFPGLEGLVDDAKFDQVYHQHYNYFSLKSVVHLLDSIGAELVDHAVNPYHWSSLMIAFRKKKNPTDKPKEVTTSLSRENILSQYNIFKRSMEVTAKRLESYRNEKIYGYGAALMLPILDYHLGKDCLKNLECIIDSDPNKKGKYYINFPTQIRSPEEVGDISNTVVLLTATMSLDAGRKIIPKLMNEKVKKIIVPLNLI